MKYEPMPIEIESPEEYNYETIRYNLSESSIVEQCLESLALSIPNLTLVYNEHQGGSELPSLIAADAGLSKYDFLLSLPVLQELFSLLPLLSSLVTIIVS